MRTLLRGKVTLLFLTLGLLLAFGGVALAENIKNDIGAGGIDTVVAGSSTTISYYIQDTGAPNTCDAADGSKATVTINAPAAVTTSASSLDFTKCGEANKQGVQFSSNTAGDYNITVTVSDTSGSYNVNPATFTLHVTTPPPPANDPPTLSLPGNQTAEATGSNGAAVTYTATANDAQDGALTPDCSPASGSTFALGSTQVNCSVTDSGGLSASGFFTVTVQDTTGPTLHLPANITEEATGPNGAAVSYNATANDLVDGSRNVTCDAASGSTFSLGTTTVHCSASDTRNNSSSGTFDVTVRDTTGPTLHLPANITTTAPNNSAATVNFTATANDLVDGSRPVTCNPASGSNFSAGTTTVNCSSSDSRSNTSNGSFTVTVNYNWSDFLQPIDRNPDQTGDPTMATVYNSAKAGQAIPIKFSLSGNQGMSIFATKNDAGQATSYPRTVKVQCPGADDTVDAIETYSSSNAGLQYDPIAGQYIYTWKTATSLAGTCQMLDLKLADGKHHYAFFKFTK